MPMISEGAASASGRGALTAADWSTFNAKQAALGYTPVNKAGDTNLGDQAIGTTTPGKSGGVDIDVGAARLHIVTPVNGKNPALFECDTVGRGVWVLENGYNNTATGPTKRAIAIGSTGLQGVVSSSGGAQYTAPVVVQASGGNLLVGTSTDDGANKLQVNGSGAFNGPVGLKSYTVTTVPAATTAGQMIYVSNEVGGATPAFSDGTNWRRVHDRAIVS